MRFVLPLLLVAFTITACIETVGTRYEVEGTKGSAKAATKAPAKAPAKSAAGTAPAKAAPAKKMNLVAEVRQRLQADCIREHGGLLGGGEKIAAQCECFSGTMMKAMARADLEFFMQYNVVPTLGGTRPNDVKKQCGLAVQSRRAGPPTSY
jgi:hypothetical protein